MMCETVISVHQSACQKAETLHTPVAHSSSHWNAQHAHTSPSHKCTGCRGTLIAIFPTTRSTHTLLLQNPTKPNTNTAHMHTTAKVPHHCWLVIYQQPVITTHIEAAVLTGSGVIVLQQAAGPHVKQKQNKTQQTQCQSLCVCMLTRPVHCPTGLPATGAGAPRSKC